MDARFAQESVRAAKLSVLQGSDLPLLFACSEKEAETGTKRSPAHSDKSRKERPMSVDVTVTNIGRQMEIKRKVGLAAMKRNKIRFRNIKLAIAIAIVCFTWAWTYRSDAQAISSPMAMVDAVQGRSDITSAGNLEPTRLTVGRTINAGNTISTDEHSKVFLQWETGIRTSLGEVSSNSFAQKQDQSGFVNLIDLNEGVVRVTKQSGGGNLTPYKVTTPMASIEPLNYYEPVDFLVEAYTPTTTAVSVISGTVLVKNLTVSHPVETIVSSSHMAYTDKGKRESDVVASKSDVIMPLINGTTIPGTAASGFICPVPIWLSSYASGRLVIPRTPFLVRAVERSLQSGRAEFGIPNFQNIRAIEVRGPWKQIN